MREELFGTTDGFGNFETVGAFGDAPNSFAILEDFVAFLLAEYSHSGREDNGKRFAVSDAVEGSEFVSDVVSRPVLRYAHRDEAVERHSGTEHILRHEVVVARIFLDLRSDFDKSL